jgi:hypothetical protein
VLCLEAHRCTKWNSSKNQCGAYPVIEGVTPAEYKWRIGRCPLAPPRELTDEERRITQIRKQTFAGKRTNVGLIKGALGYDFTKFKTHRIGKNKGEGRKHYRAFGD